VTWIVNTASRIDGKPVPVTCDYASGELYPVGTTTASCTATDPRSLQSTTVTFTVYVSDTTPPAVTFTATAHDIV
jgi:hypothetical protein